MGDKEIPQLPIWEAREWVKSAALRFRALDLAVSVAPDLNRVNRLSAYDNWLYAVRAFNEAVRR